MNRLFRERGIPGVVVDADDTREKHDSIGLRTNRSGWQVGSRKRFITARPLSAWLISDWHHKRRHMNLDNLPFEPVRSGLFYSLRLGGVWVAADWWLSYFEVDDQVIPLRLEHLLTDINRHLLPLLPEREGEFTELPKENSKPDESTDGSPILIPDDYERIWASNPRWKAWEEKIYGQTQK